MGNGAVRPAGQLAIWSISVNAADMPSTQRDHLRRLPRRSEHNSPAAAETNSWSLPGGRLSEDSRTLPFLAQAAPRRRCDRRCLVLPVSAAAGVALGRFLRQPGSRRSASARAGDPYALLSEPI